jgi:hypothetical protein
LGTEVLSHYDNARVIKSVQFRCYKGDTASASSDFNFTNIAAHVYIYYEVVGGQVVQGSPSRLSYFQSLSAFNTEAVDDIGNPVLAASQAGGKMSLFWNNGVAWIKVGGSVDTTNQVVSFRTSRVGNYQIKAAAQLGDFTLVQVYPRIITPNGDGANDVAIFQFGEGQLTAASLSGEIYDITGVKVATLRTGPDPDSTLQWDGKTDSGSVVPSGIYIYQINASGERASGTVVVAR